LESLGGVGEDRRGMIGDAVRQHDLLEQPDRQQHETIARFSRSAGNRQPRIAASSPVMHDRAGDQMWEDVTNSAKSRKRNCLMRPALISASNVSC